MDAIETLKQDVQEGRISAERLVDLVVAVQQQLQATQQQLEAAKQLIEELKKQLGGAGTTKLDEPFSVRAEEKRQEARGKKKAARKSRSGDAVVSKPATRSLKPSEPSPFFPRESRRVPVNWRTLGRCGGWKTAERR